MSIFETHMHLDLENFDQDPDRDKIICQARKSGIKKMLNIGTDAKSSQASIDLAEKHPGVYAAVGVHPHEAQSLDLDEIRELAQHKKVVAIGEVGLDYFKNYSPRDAQEAAFRSQVELAIELDLPLIVHCRDAYKDCYRILREYDPKKVLFHCYSGNYKYAQTLFSHGWLIALGGAITFNKGAQDELVSMMPSDKFVVETDCPFLTPNPHRGKRNSPLYLPYIVQKIASLRGECEQKIAKQTYKNACNFFQIRC